MEGMVVGAAVTAEMVRPNTSMVKREESTKPIKAGEHQDARQHDNEREGDKL